MSENARKNGPHFHQETYQLKSSCKSLMAWMIISHSGPCDAHASPFTASYPLSLSQVMEYCPIYNSFTSKCSEWRAYKAKLMREVTVNQDLESKINLVAEKEKLLQCISSSSKPKVRLQSLVNFLKPLPLSYRPKQPPDLTRKQCHAIGKWLYLMRSYPEYWVR